MPKSPPRLPAPQFFSKDGQKLWRETVAHMAAAGTLNANLSPQVEAYVSAILRHRRVQREIDAAELGADGTLALFRLAGSTAATVRSLARALGLATGTSAKSPRKPGREDSKWAGLLS